jgi:hypothetical protein
VPLDGRGVDGGWGVVIFCIMTFDAIAMNDRYAICFVMALRSIPMFPKILHLAWMLDITLQPMTY